MTVQSYQQNLSWTRSFSPVAESDSYPMAITSSPRQQAQQQPEQQQQQQQQPPHNQNSSGSSPVSYNYYNQGGTVLAHEAPSFYPSPSYSTDRTVNYPMALPTSSSSAPTSAADTGRHLDIFQEPTSSCNSTRNPPYCSTGGNHTSVGMHTFPSLLSTSAGIARPTARKARVPYQRRQNATSNRDSINSSESAANSPADGASAAATASYRCEHTGCGKSFTRPYNLTSHMRTHTSERPFACSQCGRRFARQHDRNRHEKLHWNIKPYVCSNCSKPFARMDALNRHLKVENGCGSILAAAAHSL